MATTEKMVNRQARTVHLRFIKTRMYSPRADSCETRSGYTRGPICLPKSTPAGCISRTVGVLACTSGPESMHSPRQSFRAFRPGEAGQAHYELQESRRREGWFTEPQLLTRMER